jgi:hypothetical protein
VVEGGRGRAAWVLEWGGVEWMHVGPGGGMLCPPGPKCEIGGGIQPL